MITLNDKKNGGACSCRANNRACRSGRAIESAARLKHVKPAMCMKSESEPCQLSLNGTRMNLADAPLMIDFTTAKREVTHNFLIAINYKPDEIDARRRARSSGKALQPSLAHNQ